MVWFHCISRMFQCDRPVIYMIIYKCIHLMMQWCWKCRDCKMSSMGWNKVHLFWSHPHYTVFHCNLPRSPLHQPHRAAVHFHWRLKITNCLCEKWFGLIGTITLTLKYTKPHFQGKSHLFSRSHLYLIRWQSIRHVSQYNTYNKITGFIKS